MSGSVAVGPADLTDFNPVDAAAGWSCVGRCLWRSFKPRESCCDLVARTPRSPVPMAVHQLPALVATDEAPCQCLHVLPGRGEGPSPWSASAAGFTWPLTVLEHELRRDAGQAGYRVGSSRTTWSGGLSAGA